MKNIWLITSFLGLLTITSPTIAQISTREGTDFWVAFMENADTTQHDHSLSIFATPLRNCSITVCNPNTGWTHTQSITPSGVNQIYIPLSQAYTVNSGLVENKGIHVTTTDTITLYAITRGYPNQDYTNVLPTHMLMSDYMVQTFPQDRYSTEFAIVAAEDNVVVDIVLKGNTRDGHVSGETYSITLPHAGNMCQIQSQRSVSSDLSGTRISARDGKKIAVFNGDACAYIPNPNEGNSCDHVVEQAMPTAYWGKQFVVLGSQRNKTDYVRITALYDNCEIRKNGTQSPGVLMNKLSFSAYNKQFEPTATDFDWLSRDAKEVEKYVKDDKCGFLCTNGFFLDLLTGIEFANSKANAETLPKDLPLLIVSGEMDPVGDMGKGVRKVYKLYTDVGIADVTLKLFKDARHELLNETNKKEVYEFLATWLEAHI